jgi:hypothetical protein
VSTHALVTSEEPLGLRIYRVIDLVVLALALPIFLATGLPLLGWAATAAAWLLQRGIQVFLERRARASDDIRTVAGLITGSMIARGWLVALAIFGAGMIEREAGLAAAILTIMLFTLYFSGHMVLRPFDDKRGGK